MDPSSFLDSTAEPDLSDWNTWSAEETSSGNQMAYRKRRSSEMINENSAKNGNFRMDGSPSAKQLRGKSSGELISFISWPNVFL